MIRTARKLEHIMKSAIYFLNFCGERCG